MNKTLALTLVLLFAPAVRADDTKSADPPTATAPAPEKPAAKAKLTKDDLQILAHYHAVNRMEIDLGKVAQKKGTRAEIKAYGDMLVKEHGESDAKLLAFAKKHGQKIPAPKPATAVEKQEQAQAKATAAKLKKLSGADFDRQFLIAMVGDHERELAKIDLKIADAKSTELADMLKAKKPVLQHHADHARELLRSDAQAMR